MPTKMRQVAISAAMVIPEMGLDEVPMMPTMRLDTVTKKNPKATISTPNRSFEPRPLPGMNGKSATMRTSAAEPPITTDRGRSFSVRRGSTLTPPRMLPIAPLKAWTMVGSVLMSVMKPPAATAPAPICLM